MSSSRPPAGSRRRSGGERSNDTKDCRRRPQNGRRSLALPRGRQVVPREDSYRRSWRHRPGEAGILRLFRMRRQARSSVAELDGANRRLGRTGEYAQLRFPTCWVQSRSSGQGIGNALLLYLCRLMKGDGLQTARLHTHATRTAAPSGFTSAASQDHLARYRVCKEHGRPARKGTICRSNYRGSSATSLEERQAPSRISRRRLL